MALTRKKKTRKILVSELNPLTNNFSDLKKYINKQLWKEKVR